MAKEKLTREKFRELSIGGVRDFGRYDLSLLKAQDFENVSPIELKINSTNLQSFNPKFFDRKSIFGADLSDNDLSFMKENAFDDAYVVFSNLSNCNLKNINPQRVRTKSLFGTNLSNNNLDYFNESSLDDVEVNGTNFSKCNLKYFDPQRVYNKSLNGTNLSFNNLSSLKPEAFYDVAIDNTNFENTGAHIDLTKVRRNIEINIGNMKGCTVINFEEAMSFGEKIIYDEDCFDEKFISTHKEYFLDKNAPDELKKEFYGRNLRYQNFVKHYECIKDKNYKLFLGGKQLQLFDFLKWEDIQKIIKKNPRNIDLLLELNKHEEIYNWYNTYKFVPHFTVAVNFPKDQIHKFNFNRWSNLMKYEEFNNDNDAKLGLLKAAMVMGVFEKEDQGYTKLLQMLNQEPKVLKPNKVHRIFDSMKMVYDGDFRNLFMENLKRILSDSTFAEKISSVQRNYADIKEEYKGKKVTLEMCENYLENISYDNVKEGCHELAIYAKNNGYNQSSFEKMQETFLEGKQRESSSIPEIRVETEKLKGRMLRLDDPLTLVLGNLTECCQKLHGVGESAMLHSVLEKNGRVFVVEDEAGQVVAQSWVWRNGNVLCFDNIEVPDRALGHQKEILEVYKRATNKSVRKDKKAFDRLLSEGKILEEEAKRLRLAKITVGKGYTDVVLDKLEKDNERIKPQESNKIYNDKELYISDSKEQYVLYKATGYKKTEGKLKIDSLNLYKDERDTAKEVKGEKIHKDIIKLIKGIESQAISQEMQVLQEIQSYKDIAKAYDCDKDKMRVVYNKDWYMVYEEKGNCAHMGDMARMKATVSNENKMIEKEQEQALYKMLNKYKQAFIDVRSSETYNLVSELKDRGKIKVLLDKALRDFVGTNEKRYELIITKNETTKDIENISKRFEI